LPEESTPATENATVADCVRAGLDAWSIPYTQLQIDRLVRYTDMLIDWNANRFNLTRITTPREIAIEHFLDSLALLTAAQVRRSATLLDIGPGAGFPSLPLKILRPDIRPTLVEATAKKLTFCQAIVDAFDLASVRLIHGRADERLSGLRRSFDLVTARAVAPLKELIPMSEPYLKPTGVLAAYKGARAEEELSEAGDAIAKLNLSATIRSVAIPGSDRIHAIVLCRHR
jgi:16S rRNA (guanine527-N7)-methyltransferase